MTKMSKMTDKEPLINLNDSDDQINLKNQKIFKLNKDEDDSYDDDDDNDDDENLLKKEGNEKLKEKKQTKEIENNELKKHSDNKILVQEEISAGPSSSSSANRSRNATSASPTTTTTTTTSQNPTTSSPASTSQQPTVHQQSSLTQQQSNPVLYVRSRTAAISNEIKNDPYESLDYDVCDNVLFKEEQKKYHNARFTIRKDILRWIIFVLIGIVTALIACLIDLAIEPLIELKYDFLKKSVDTNVEQSLPGNMRNLVVPYLYWILLSVVPVAVGSIMVTYIEPITAGSGMPQVKSYLNGVKIHKIVRIKTLAVKAIGVITAVVGGLVGGKEGPMAHAGAVVAAGISQGKSTTFIKDFGIFKAFRDDHEKRDFVLGGAAAGVAAAFGSPIGGMLFSLEEAASFWNQNLIWRTLIASVISSFTLNIVLSAYHGLKSFMFIGLFNLGKFDQPLIFQYYELPIFVLYGVLGGLFGALWNSLNTKLNRFRKRFIVRRWANVIEAMMISALGVTLACLTIYFMNDCRPLGTDPTNQPIQLFCEDNEYNAVAALWFQAPEATVRSLLHDPPGAHKIVTLLIFIIIYYFLACLTFGLMVSLGIFIPTALIGAAWGRLLAMIINIIFPQTTFLNLGKYALVGAAAHLGGVLRMTISLSVILMETTGIETSFFFPLIVTLVCAKWVGDYFNEGIYDIQIKMNHVPLLPWEPLPKYKTLTASKIMSSPVICIKKQDKAKYIYDVLKSCNHNGFPVVEDVVDDNRSNGRVCGIILRSQLVVILLRSLYEEKKRFWEEETTIQTFRDLYPRYPSIDCVKMNSDKVDYTVNLDTFMNPSPIRCGEYDSVTKSFNKFRALGLRHMIVINRENRVVGIITRKDFLYK